MASSGAIDWLITPRLPVSAMLYLLPISDDKSHNQMQASSQTEEKNHSISSKSFKIFFLTLVSI